MTKSRIALLFCALAGPPLVVGDLFAESAESSWTGEVVDVACYVGSGARGSDHAGCAKACVKSGQPMGLLTDGGELLLLAAGEDGEAYEVLKDLAGEKSEVSGVLSEKGGMKIVVVAAISYWSCGNHSPHHAAKSHSEMKRLTKNHGCASWSKAAA